MTDAGSLQVSLAILGGLVLAGVVAHGAWTSRKNQPRQATPLAPLHQAMSESPGADPAVNIATSGVETAREPVLDTGPYEASGTAQDGVGGYLNERMEPTFGDNMASQPGRQTVSASLDKIPRLDALLDAVASISLARPVSSEAAFAAMPSTRRAGSKQFAFEGLDSLTGEWEFPVAGASYTSIQCGVQLANRHGALNAIEFSEFVVKVQAAADALGADAEFPDMLDTVARAKELDQFASDHDAQISFTLRALDAAWSHGYIQQCAARHGFTASLIPGRLLLLAEPHSQIALLTLIYTPPAELTEELVQPGLREVQLVLDVPQVSRELQAFPRMCEVALALAAAMDGEIVDDKDTPIHAKAMESIFADLAQLYDALESRDFAAGAPLARRLFS